MKIKTKLPPKLSPQETRVHFVLTKQRKACVSTLYRIAKQISPDEPCDRTPRSMQQHVGVIVQRLNKKRKKFVIVPGDEPRTYRITRRR